MIISSCKIKVNSAGDWQIKPPTGQYTRIGDLLTPVHAAVEDDLCVSGKMETGGFFYATGIGETYAMDHTRWLRLVDTVFMQILEPLYNEISFYANLSELITIPVGQGAAGVNGAVNLNPADSIIIAVMSRVKTAPGGGATLVNLGRSTNVDEYLQNGPVAAGSKSYSTNDGDGVAVGPIYNDTDRVMKVTTDNNVTGSDMVIRVTTYYCKFYAPDS